MWMGGVWRGWSRLGQEVGDDCGVLHEEVGVVHLDDLLRAVVGDSEVQCLVVHLVEVVLAAGAGRRLGRGPQALLTRGDGLTLVESMVLALLDGGCRDVTVVTGARGAEVPGVLDGRDLVSIVDNPGWSSGMGSSLRCGLQTIGPGHDVIVTPVD